MPRRTLKRSKSSKSRGKGADEQSRPETAVENKSAQITRIVLLSSAASTHSATVTEVHAAKSQQRSRGSPGYSYTIAGVAEIEFSVSDDEEERTSNRRQRTASDPNESSHEGDGPSSFAHRGSLELESSPHEGENAEIEGYLASLPAQVGMQIGKTMRRTKRLQRAAARFEKLFAPTSTAFAEALAGAEPPTLWACGGAAHAPIEPPVAVIHEGFQACGSGVGHPVIRLLQRIIRVQQRAHESSTFSKVLEMAVCEFFHQYFLSNGTTSINQVLELVRSLLAIHGSTVSAMGKESDSHKHLPVPSSARIGRSREDEVTSGGSEPSTAAAFGLRDLWLSSLHPWFLAMRSIFCATRADSPDVHLHFLEVGLMGSSDSFAQDRSRPSSSRSRSRKGKGASSRSPMRRDTSDESMFFMHSPHNGSLAPEFRRGSGMSTSKFTQSASPPDPSSPMSPDTSDIWQEGSSTSQINTLTATAARRLQFWDGFFAYRSLGAVSRELAANQLEPKADSDDDDPTELNHLMYNLPKRGTGTHHYPASTSSKGSTLSSPFCQLPLDQMTPKHSVGAASAPSTYRAASQKLHATTDGLFPSLEQRRQLSYLSSLRRPPGATAEPSTRGGQRQADDEEEAASGAVANSGGEGRSLRKGDRDLPPLVVAAKNVVGAATRLQAMAQGRVSSSGTVESIVKDPLMFPMFMGSTAAQKKEDEQPMPFVTNGVCFEVQPLTFAKARRAAEHEAKVRAELNKGNSAPKEKERGRSASKRWSSRTGSGLGDGSSQPTDRRCKYCAHHGITTTGSVMPAKYEQKVGRAFKRRSSSTTGSSAATARVCTTCGGDVDIPFTPNPPRLLVEASLGTPLEPATNIAQARTRSPAQTSARPRAFGAVRTSAGQQPGKTGASETSPDKPSGQAPASGHAATIPAPMTLEDAGLSESPRRTAAYAYGLPKRILSDSLDDKKVAVGNVYFTACEKHHARPLPEGATALTESGALIDSSTNTLRIYSDPFMAGTSNQDEDVFISLRGSDLDDKGLAAFIESITQKGSDFGGGGIHVDLAGNRLTDEGLHRLLSTLEEPLEWAKRLETLDVARNRMLTATAIEPLCSLLAAEKLPRLRTLRIGGVELTESFAASLFKGIDAAASSNLEELDISYLGLGRSGLAGPAAAAALIRQCQALCTLDASGNHLNFDAISLFGHALADVGSAQTLHFAHNTGNWPVVAGSVHDKQQDFMHARRTNAAGAPPPFGPHPCTAMTGLWMHLPKIQTLRVLDLRDAQVDPRCAFMLACAVHDHKNMEAILLNGNPLGSYGVRALLTIAFLAEPPREASRSHLSVLTLDQCEEGSMLALDVPPLSPADPSGSYVFDLRDPWSGTAVQYCLRRWHSVRNNLPFEKAFPYLDLDGKALREISQAPDGSFELPRSGVISFTCLLPRALEHAAQLSDLGFRIRPQDYHRRALSPALEQRALQIASACHSLVSLQAFVHALSADFRLRGIVVKTLCQWMSAMGSAGFIAQNHAADILSDGVSDTDCDVELLEIMSAPRVTPSPAALRDCRSTFDFIPLTNPTGHYVLNLTWPSERIMAEELLLVNSWETEVAKALCVPDLSKTGNYQYLRNEALNSTSFVYRPDWLLPTTGIFEFDFAVPRRLPKTSRTLDEDSWQKLKAALASPGDTTPAMVKVLCLRRVSPQLSLTSQQALSIFGIFQTAAKAEGASAGNKRDSSGLPTLVEMALLSVLIFRIKDRQNIRQAFFKNPGPFCKTDRLRSCEHAFGCLNLADPMHISHQELRLNLDVHEERQYCRMVLNIAYQEGGRTLDPKSFSGCAYGPGPPERKFTHSVPPDRWVKTGLPRRGVLVVTYLCEEGNTRYRRRQAQHICGWEL